MTLYIPIKKTGRMIETQVADFAGVPIESIAAIESAIDSSPAFRYAIEYGLKQSVNDAHANEPDHAKADALADKKLAALLAGTIRDRGETESIDPVAQEAMNEARKLFNAAPNKLVALVKFREDWKRAKGEEIAAKDAKKMIVETIARQETTIATAKASIEARKIRAAEITF